MVVKAPHAAHAEGTLQNMTEATSKHCMRNIFILSLQNKSVMMAKARLGPSIVFS
jgi:hypothetical protein